MESDGTKRTVDYSADPHNGFSAVVHKEPVAVHAPVVTKVSLPAVAYAAPVAHASYAAPVAHAYSTPVVAHGYAAPSVAHGYTSYGYAAPAVAHGYASQAYAAHSPAVAYTAHHSPAW